MSDIKIVNDYGPSPGVQIKPCGWCKRPKTAHKDHCPYHPKNKNASRRGPASQGQRVRRRRIRASGRIARASQVAILLGEAEAKLGEAKALVLHLQTRVEILRELRGG